LPRYTYPDTFLYAFCMREFLGAVAIYEAGN